MFEIYVISAVICYITLLVSCKIIDGEVTVKDVLLAICISIIPVVNVVAAIYTIIYILDKLGVWNRKVF